MSEHKVDVLVVDDQLGVRSLLTVALSDRGYTVITASNGSEGVDLVKKLNPSLVLMDVKMPVKDGVTALYEIKKINSRLPVIMMTAYSESSTIEAIKKGGAEQYMFKPFDIDKLLKMVEYFLKGDTKAYA